MAEEYAQTPSGVVLQHGRDVWIDYVPEPDVSVPFRILDGGRVLQRGEGLAVQFRQVVRRAGGEEPVVIAVTSARPGLAQLAHMALVAASEAREREARRRVRHRPGTSSTAAGSPRPASG